MLNLYFLFIIQLFFSLFIDIPFCSRVHLIKFENNDSISISNIEFLIRASSVDQRQFFTFYN